MLLAEIGQALIALGFSGAIALWLGATVYWTVAVVIGAICGWLLFEHSLRELKVAKYAPQMWLSTFLTPLIMAVIWPAVPPILIYTGWRRRAQVEKS